jgi:hypothetical protein
MQGDFAFRYCPMRKAKVSVHLAKQFQKRRFLEINQPETRIAYGSHVC